MQINILPEELPRCWYNILPDLPQPLPEVKGDLSVAAKILVGECVNQEFSNQRWIAIPEELWLNFQKSGRPRPLFRATNLEKALKLPPGIELYCKGEFQSPTGSHKVNTALTQAFFAKKEGKKRLVTETGAGQWGSALAYAASLMELDCTIYWVRAVYNWKKSRRYLMKFFGAKVFASPSKNTEVGRNLLKENPSHPGSLGIAISESIEDVLSHPDTVYCLGSVLNCVLLHQTIIGLEAKAQLQKINRYPDVIISCVGGGSNFGGLALPFFGDLFREGKKIKFVAAQSEGAANLKGEYRYNFADYAGLAPQFKMYTLGHQTKLPPIKGDGLRYHGCSPIISLLRHLGLIEVKTYPTDEKYVFEKARLFLRTEGWLLAPESAYSAAAAIDEAERAKEAGEKKIILFNCSGHGFMDMEGYHQVLRL